MTRAKRVSDSTTVHYRTNADLFCGPAMPMTTVRWLQVVSLGFSESFSDSKLPTAPGKFCYPASVSTIVHPPASSLLWNLSYLYLFKADQCDLPVHLSQKELQKCWYRWKSAVSQFHAILTPTHRHHIKNSTNFVSFSNGFSLVHKHLLWFLTSEKPWWQGR